MIDKSMLSVKASYLQVTKNLSERRERELRTSRSTGSPKEVKFPV